MTFSQCFGGKGNGFIGQSQSGGHECVSMSRYPLSTCLFLAFFQAWTHPVLFSPMAIEDSFDVSMLHSLYLESIILTSLLTRSSTILVQRPPPFPTATQQLLSLAQHCKTPRFQSSFFIQNPKSMYILQPK